MSPRQTTVAAAALEGACLRDPYCRPVEKWSLAQTFSKCRCLSNSLQRKLLFKWLHYPNGDACSSDAAADCFITSRYDPFSKIRVSLKHKPVVNKLHIGVWAVMSNRRIVGPIFLIQKCIGNKFYKLSRNNFMTTKDIMDIFSPRIY